MKISIIIPVFNGEKYIERCVNSIEQGKKYNKNIDVIIVDDGSTDSTYTISENLTKRYDNIRVFHKKNGGVSSARNFGLTVAQGDFALFVDADDTLNKMAFPIIIKEIQNHEADYYMFPLEKEVKKGIIQKQNYSVIGKTVSVDEAYEYFYIDGNNGPWSKLFKLEILKKHGIHFHKELKIHEDVVFCMEYLEHCRNIRYCEEVIYTYSYNETGALRRHKIEYLDNYSTVYYFWREYFWRHGLERYIEGLNCSFLHKMLTTSAKLVKHGTSVSEINHKLDDNQLFREIKRMNFKGIRWNTEKELLIHKMYYLISMKVK